MANGGDEVELQVEFSFILPYVHLCCLNDLEDTHHKIRVITQKIFTFVRSCLGCTPGNHVFWLNILFILFLITFFNLHIISETYCSLSGGKHVVFPG